MSNEESAKEVKKTEIEEPSIFSSEMDSSFNWRPRDNRAIQNLINSKQES
jgi:hypothetical protein